MTLCSDKLELKANAARARSPEAIPIGSAIVLTDENTYNVGKAERRRENNGHKKDVVTRAMLYML